MKRYIKDFTKKLLKKSGLALMYYENYQELMLNNLRGNDLEFILKLPREHSLSLLDYLEKSKSQLRQDLFVLSELGFKRGGYFIEFGAANGCDLSNSYILEKEFGWNGILAEPAICWHKQLLANRNCIIEHDCVWRESGTYLNFNEVEMAEYSTIETFSFDDFHHSIRKNGKSYQVKTITLKDLLDKHGAPREIDYLSIDTEGSEYEILKSFDFNSYKIKVITCEHNYTAMRQKIYDLLTSFGYIRKHENFSKFDDWYVLA